MNSKTKVPGNKPLVVTSSLHKVKACNTRKDRFVNIAGCLKDSDAQEMCAIIEAGCEKI
jgi:hypothetical protein